jgi:hypothetical protein
MTHRRARSWMALAAGGDLGPGRKRRLEEHLAACADCREEFRTYEEALGLAASLAAKDKTPDWTEAEWRLVIGRAAGQEPEKQRASRRPLPGWAWAGAAALLIVAILGAVMLLKRSSGPRLSVVQPRGQDPILAEKSLSPEARPEGPAAVESAPAPRQQDRLLARSTGWPPARPAGPSASSAAADPTPTQTVMAMTFVSQETGLTVHWTFNDNFTYQEDKK